VGERVGSGVCVGNGVGSRVGGNVGGFDGIGVGGFVGFLVGGFVGALDGGDEGGAVGSLVGCFVILTHTPFSPHSPEQQDSCTPKQLSPMRWHLFLQVSSFPHTPEQHM